MSDDAETTPTVTPEESGSAGSQVEGTPIQALELVRRVPPESHGLVAVTTAAQLAELAKSDESPEVKREIVVGMLLGAHQATEADLKLRLQAAEKDLRKARRQLSDVKGEIGILRGDVRVRDARIVHLHSHKTRDQFLGFVSSVLFGVGGAFIGRSWAATILGFVTGLLLFVYSWFHGDDLSEKTE